MRLIAALFAKGKKPDREPIPFQEILPMKLKPGVSGKGDKTTDVCCIQEMTIMLSCLKSNEYNQSLCPKEIDNFKKCYSNYRTTKDLKKEFESKGITTPGDKRLPYKQLNKLLSRYPLL